MFRPIGLTLFTCLAFIASSSFAFGPMMTVGKSNARSMVTVDKNFLAGKTIVANRDKTIGKIKLCLKSDNGYIPVKRSTLKPYVHATYDQFIDSLHECDKPETSIVERLGEDNTDNVVYYFNRRYKLELIELSQPITVD